MEKQVILPMEQYDAIMKVLDTNLKENVVSFTREEHGQQNVYLNYILSKDEAVKELTEELEEIKPRHEECIKHNTKLLEEQLRWQELIDKEKESLVFQQKLSVSRNERVCEEMKGKDRAISVYKDRLKSAHEGWAKTNKQVEKLSKIVFWLSISVVALVVFIINAMINQAQ